MNQKIQSYQDLVVWQEGMELVKMIYQLVKLLPKSEQYGMVQQMCHAAVSIPANIAEGHGSSHRKVFQNHLSIARGSLMELETYVLLTEKLQYLKSEQNQTMKSQIQKVGRLLSGLIRSLK